MTRSSARCETTKPYDASNERTGNVVSTASTRPSTAACSIHIVPRRSRSAPNDHLPTIAEGRTSVCYTDAHEQTELYEGPGILDLKTKEPRNEHPGCIARSPGVAGPLGRGDPRTRSADRRPAPPPVGSPRLALSAGRAAGGPEQRPQHRRHRLPAVPRDAPRRRPRSRSARSARRSSSTASRR